MVAIAVMFSGNFAESTCGVVRDGMTGGVVVMAEACFDILFNIINIMRTSVVRTI